MKTYVFMDIDATVADATRRIKKAGPEPLRSDKKAYLKWLNKIQNEESLAADQPVKGMPALLRALSNNHYMDLIYLTSREEGYRKVTEAWLDKHVPYRIGASLIMRPNDCWLSAAEFKERAIQLTSQGSNEVIVFDDDESGELEKLCKKHGWTFFKARSGGAL